MVSHFLVQKGSVDMNYTNTTARSIGLPLYNLGLTENYAYRAEDDKGKRNRSSNDILVYNVTTTESQDEALVRRWAPIPQVNTDLKVSYPLSKGRNGAIVRFGIQEIVPEINSITGDRQDHTPVLELSMRGDYSERVSDEAWTEAIARLISSLPYVIRDGKVVFLVNKAIKGSIGMFSDPV